MYLYKYTPIEEDFDTHELASGRSIIIRRVFQFMAPLLAPHFGGVGHVCSWGFEHVTLCLISGEIPPVTPQKPPSGLPNRLNRPQNSVNRLEAKNRLTAITDQNTLCAWSVRSISNYRTHFILQQSVGVMWSSNKKSYPHLFCGICQDSRFETCWDFQRWVTVMINNLKFTFKF